MRRPLRCWWRLAERSPALCGEMRVLRRSRDRLLRGVVDRTYSCEVVPEYDEVRTINLSFNRKRCTWLKSTRIPLSPKGLPGLAYVAVSQTGENAEPLLVQLRVAIRAQPLDTDGTSCDNG